MNPEQESSHTLSQEQEKQELLNMLFRERESLEERKKRGLEGDEYHRERIYLESGERIIKQEGTSAFWKWVGQEGTPQAGTYALAEKAMKEGWTNFQYIREHYLANAQGRSRKRQFPNHIVKKDLDQKENK